MYWQANANTPLSVTPLLNVPEKRPRLFRKILGRPRRIHCYWEMFFGPQKGHNKWRIEGRFRSATYPSLTNFWNSCFQWVHLFWCRDVVFVVSRWPKSPFWYRDLFSGIKKILHSAFQLLDRPLPGINLSVLFWASTSCKLEVKEDLDTEKKIKKSRYQKTNISMPTKRVNPNQPWAATTSGLGVKQLRQDPGALRQTSQALSGKSGMFHPSLKKYPKELV